MTSSLEEENCQPMGAFYGKGARLKLDKKADDFLKFNFNNLHASFDYEIKISKFAAEVFKGVHCEEGNYFAPINGHGSAGSSCRNKGYEV